MRTNTYHTYLFSKQAYDDFVTMIRRFKCHSYGMTYDQLGAIDIERAPDGEVVFVLNDKNAWRISPYVNPPWSRGEYRFFTWFAKLIKTTAVDAEGIVAWERRSAKTAVIRYTDVSCDPHAVSVVASKNAHFYYDKLLNHKKLSKIYGSEFVESLLGNPSDPITTEIEIARREELAALKSECEKMCEKLEKECEEKCEDINDKAEAECDVVESIKDKKIAALKTKLAQDIEDLDKRYKDLLAPAAQTK